MFHEFSAGSQKRKSNSMWLTSLADLLALLLAFFVMVFAMNEIKRDSWQEILDVLGNPLNLNKKITDVGPTADENLELFTEQKAFDLDYLNNILSAKISSSEQLKNVEIFKASDRLIVSFLGDSFFGAGVSEVSEELINATRLLGDTFRYVKNRVEVYGHSDPEPISNQSPDALTNWSLSFSLAHAPSSVSAPDR